MLRDVDWLLPDLTHPFPHIHLTCWEGGELKQKKAVCTQKWLASGGADRLLGDTCVFWDNLIIPFVSWIIGFYRTSAGNLWNSRNNSLQWIATWWKNSYFVRKHGGFVLSQWWLWWYNSACSFSVSSLSFPLTTAQIPTSSQPFSITL